MECLAVLQRADAKVDELRETVEALKAEGLSLNVMTARLNDQGVRLVTYNGHSARSNHCDSPASRNRSDKLAKSSDLGGSHVLGIGETLSDGSVGIGCFFLGHHTGRMWRCVSSAKRTARSRLAASTLMPMPKNRPLMPKPAVMLRW
jgi:hypothetical protein